MVNRLTHFSGFYLRLILFFFVRAAENILGTAALPVAFGKAKLIAYRLVFFLFFCVDLVKLFVFCLRFFFLVGVISHNTP